MGGGANGAFRRRIVLRRIMQKAQNRIAIIDLVIKIALLKSQMERNRAQQVRDLLADVSDQLVSAWVVRWAWLR